jgi:predicted negative regulator of RcsB-dependent stress response
VVQDPFIAHALEFAAWARANSRAIIVGGITLAIVVVGFLIYRNNRETIREQAATELAEVRQTVQTGNTALAVRELESFISRFGGTESADEARLLLASTQLEAGQAQQAADVVEPLARDLDDPLGVPAALLQGAAYEAANEPARAEAIYLRVVDDAEPVYQRREALDAAARLRMQTGNAAGAAELYRRLVEMTPTDQPIRAVYEMRLGEAVAAAGAAPAATPTR